MIVKAPVLGTQVDLPCPAKVSAIAACAALIDVDGKSLDAGFWQIIAKTLRVCPVSHSRQVVRTAGIALDRQR